MKVRNLDQSSLLTTVATSSQLQTEATYLHQKNLKYMETCSELEFKVSELKATLEAKNIEIEKLKLRNCTEGGKHTRLSSQAIRSLQELRTYHALLDQENAHLRKLTANPLEVERLKAELAQVRQLQQLYKEKLQEIQEKCLEDGCVSMGQKRGNNSSAEALKALETDLKTQVKAVYEETESLSKERDYFKDTVVPVLKQTVALFGQHKANLISEIEELEGHSSPQKTDRTPSFSPPREFEAAEMVPNLKLPRPGSQLHSVSPPPLLSPTSAHMKSVMQHGLSPRLGSRSVLQSKSSASTSRSGRSPIYSPSFLRVKKLGVKVKAKQTIRNDPIAEEDDFANSFPEEDELDAGE